MARHPAPTVSTLPIEARRNAIPRWARSAILRSFGLSLLALATISVPTMSIAADSKTPGARVMLEPLTSSLIATYYESFLRDHDIDAFVQRVSARYTEGTLTRLVESGPTTSRRAAVLALGLIGSYATNASVARALRDSDPVVRNLADNALWAIWFRADTSENNEALGHVRELNSRQQYRAAEELATRLILKSPKFAEAYNQRAIARFLQEHYEASATDCQRTLKLNPYHVGALGGLAQCQIQLDQRREAIKTLRRALQLQPYHEGLRDSMAILEAQE
jgi:tetratricopeptide (TPR) repeat protein